MENIEKLLDAAKHAKGVTTDYALAKALDLPKQRVSDYYKGSRVPDEFACLQIAKALGKPLDSVIATVKAATEKDEKRREVWENYMKSLGGVAAAFVMGLLTVCHFENDKGVVSTEKSTVKTALFATDTNYAKLRLLFSRASRSCARYLKYLLSACMLPGFAK